MIILKDVVVRDSLLVLATVFVLAVDLTCTISSMYYIL
jgi:hypothetical protein